MALTRQQKEEVVESYVDRLGRCEVIIWADYRGLGVKGFEALRAQLRQTGAETMVVKNTLMRVALDRAALPLGDAFMEGPNAVTFVYGEIAPAARAVVSFARENDQAFKIKGGLVGGRMVDAGAVAELTNLPTREVLLARVVGGMASPISGLVTTLSAVVGGLVNVVNARREQLEGAAG